MIRVLFDIDMPKSCAECPFMVHCDSCESWENRCPILGKKIGYDYNKPYTPRDHRQENCPLKEVEERPHGEWEKVGDIKEAYDIEGNKTWGQKRKCTNCDFIKTYVEDFGFYSICPNCGASMVREGERNEMQ